MPARLMLDPSLFLTPRSLQMVSSAWEAKELAKVVIPASFGIALRERTVSDRASKFLGAQRETAILSDAARFLSRAREIEAYSGQPTVERESAFFRTLRKDMKDPLAFQILVEEWDFLTSHSWIASRTRRPFAAFIKAGAVAVETGRLVRNLILDQVMENRPDDVPRPLIGNKRLRRGSKWLAYSGANLAWLHGTVPGVVAGIGVASLFYLFDE